MPRAAANRIDIEYDTVGDPSHPALLLVMGLGAQLLSWEDGFCKMLADHGYYVIRYDNRDVGLSTYFDGEDVDVPALMAAVATGAELPKVPYLLSDMAADGMGLLDALGIASAHIVGASMGGMIAQTMAIEHPERVLTLTSIMSTTGEPEYLQPSPAAAEALMTPLPVEREAFIERSVNDWRILASPRYYDPVRQAERSGEAYDRAFHPQGTARQLAAVAASGSRAGSLRTLHVPTLVIHGRADQLVPLPGGERTAELVPGASLLVLDDAGHDIPTPLWPFVTSVIAAHLAHNVA